MRLLFFPHVHRALLPEICRYYRRCEDPAAAPGFSLGFDFDESVSSVISLLLISFLFIRY